MTDEYDWDDWEPYNEEPDEPDWGYYDEPRALCGHERRRAARATRHRLRTYRKIQRHARDRFWLARNYRKIERQARSRAAFDDMPPF